MRRLGAKYQNTMLTHLHVTKWVCILLGSLLLAARGAGAQCAADEYDDGGTCTACFTNSTSPAGSTSINECACVEATYRDLFGVVTPFDMGSTVSLTNLDSDRHKVRIQMVPGTDYAFVSIPYQILRVHKITGESVLVAGSGTQGFQDGVGSNALFRTEYGDDHMALNNDNTILYIADAYNSKIRKIDITSIPSSVTTMCDFLKNGGPTPPEHMIWKDEYLFVTMNTGEIQKCDVVTESCAVVLDLNSRPYREYPSYRWASMKGFHVSPAGKVFVHYYYSKIVYVYEIFDITGTPSFTSLIDLGMSSPIATIDRSWNPSGHKWSAEQLTVVDDSRMAAVWTHSDTSYSYLLVFDWSVGGPSTHVVFAHNLGWQGSNYGVGWENGYLYYTNNLNNPTTLLKTFIGGANSPACTNCPTSKTSLAGATEQDDCQCGAGYTGTDTCTQCTEGTYKAVLGSAECQICPEGSANDLSFTTCICEPGFEPDGVNGCQLCATDTYKAESGSDACQTCPALFTSPQGSTSVNDCVCTSNYYDTAGTCTACPTGKFSNAGSTAAADCQCGAGYTGTDTCTQCTEGTYKADLGSAACQACLATTVSNPTYTACGCEEGTYLKPGDAIPLSVGGGFLPAQCTACPNGTFSSFGSTACRCIEEGEYYGEDLKAPLSLGNTANIIDVNSELSNVASNTNHWYSFTPLPGTNYAFFAYVYRIWRVDLTTGSIVLVAGQDYPPGFSDGTGASAKFSLYSSGHLLALNGDNTQLYVADYENMKIRIIDITSIPSSVTSMGHTFNYNDLPNNYQPKSLIWKDGYLYVMQRYGSIQKCSIADDYCSLIIDVNSLPQAFDKMPQFFRVTPKGRVLYSMQTYSNPYTQTFYEISNIEHDPLFSLLGIISSPWQSDTGWNVIGESTIFALWRHTSTWLTYMNVFDLDLNVDGENSLVLSQNLGDIGSQRVAAWVDGYVYYKTANAPYTSVLKTYIGLEVLSDQCVDCPMGKYTLFGGTEEADCNVCAPGYTGPDDGECTFCAEGTYKDESGSSACQTCPVASVPNAARTGCGCGPGSEFSSTGTCQLCENNYFKNSEEDEPCQECRPNSMTESQGTSDSALCLCITGFYNLNSATDECLACGIGTYKDTNANEVACATCPNGSTSPAGSTSINDCACDAGAYMDLLVGGDTSPACVDCPTSKTSLSGATEQDDCQCGAGYTGTDTCTQCEEGTYKAVLGSAACQICPANSVSPQESTSIDDCSCANNYYNDTDTCMACPTGKFSNAGSTAAADCQCNAGYTGTDTCTQCTEGKYKADLGSAACQACLATTVSNPTYTVCGCEEGMYYAVPGPQLPLSMGNTFNLISLNTANDDVSSFTPLPSTNYAFVTIPHQILRIDLTTGEYVLVAGQSTSGFVDGTGASAKFSLNSENHHLALNSDNTMLVVADEDNFRLRFVDITSIPSQVTTHAYVFPWQHTNGGRPTSVLWQSDGNIYVITAYGAIWKCGSEVCSVQKSRDSGYYNPRRWHKTPEGRILFSEHNSNTVQTIWEIQDLETTPVRTAINWLFDPWQTKWEWNTIGDLKIIAVQQNKDTLISHLNVYDLSLTNPLIFSHNLGWSTGFNSFTAWADGYAYYTNADSNPTTIIKTYIGLNNLPDQCIDCPTTKYSLFGGQGEAACNLCAPGYTGPDDGECTFCADGTYKDESGSSACQTCPGASAPNAARTGCGCGPGSETSINGICQLCEYDHFKSSWEDEPCQECRPNSMTESQGTTDSALCLCIAGFYNLNSATDECLACGIGTYQDTNANQVECTTCPNDATTAIEAAVAATDCVCNAGYTGTIANTASVCTACEAGTYKSSTGTSECNACPAGATSPVASTSSNDCTCTGTGWEDSAGGACVCSAGYYGENCTTCPANSYCPGGETALRIACANVSISPAGSDAVDDCLCDMGYSGVDASVCQSCGVDTYKDVPGASNCTSCPDNTQSPAASRTPDACVANAGYYFSGGTVSACPDNSDSVVGSTSLTDCKCNAGYTGPDGGLCTACDAGTYKTTLGSGSCTSCHDNSISLAGSTSAGACLCQPGYHKMEQSGNCAGCDYGYYKEGISDVTSCTDCVLGNTLQPASTSINDCFCGAGTYLVVPDPFECDICPPNTYTDTQNTNTSCTQCPVNTNTSGPASDDITDCICTYDFTGPDGGACTACDSATYKSVLGSSACLNCPSGSSCSWNTDSSSTSLTCNPGYSGADGGPCQVCTNGTYKATTGSEACTPCHDNSISPAGSTSADDCLCQPGYHKMEQSGNCAGCDYGYYKEGISDVTSCTDCVLGNTLQPASTSINDCYCGAGTYLVVPDPFECDICPPNRYTDAQNVNTSCTQCPANTETSGPASDDITDCRCTYDFTGPDGGECTACASGKYKSVLGSSACLNCSTGSTCTWNPDTSSKVTTCNAGYTADGSGCTACVEGKYKAVTGASECETCNNNSISSLASTALTNCQCNAGYSGPNGGTCSQCTANTYKDVIGDADCQNCTLYSTSPAGSDNITDCVCNFGYISTGDGSCGRDCAAGFESDPETNVCVGCGNGKYKPEAGDESCTQCPDHSSHSLYNQTSIAACVCEHGFISNSDTHLCDACENGKFNNYAGETQCFDCFANTSGLCVASDDGTMSCTDICQTTAGYQITASGTNLEICPAHTYNDGSYTTCQTCPAGSAMTDATALGSTSVLDCACQPGYFRNATSLLCEACLVGEIKTSTGDAPCEQCPAGMTTLSTASTVCVCVAGFEPNTDNTDCQACPAGEAKFVIGNLSCIACTDHATLADTGVHDISACVCNPGYTGTHLACDACNLGTYKSSFGSSECTNCTEFATTSFLASNSILNCTCMDLYEAHPDGGPTEIAGQCIFSCKPGTYKLDTACVNCPQGFYKDVSGPQQCTLCPSPRNASKEGADNINNCSCRGGEMALGGSSAQIDAVTGVSDADLEQHVCASQAPWNNESSASTVYTATGFTCTQQREPPMEFVFDGTISGNQVTKVTRIFKDIVLSHDYQRVRVKVERAGTQIKVFECETAQLCAGIRTISMPPIRVDKVIVHLIDAFTENKQVTMRLHTRAQAVFSNTEGVPAWNEAQAQTIVLSQNLQPGDRLFDSTTAVFDDSVNSGDSGDSGDCVPCAQGLICADYIE